MRNPMMWISVCCLASVADLGKARADDCSKCDVTVGPWAVFHANPAICPGPNAVVCDREYQKEQSAKCVAGGMELVNCKANQNKGQKNYPTLLYPANSCGVVTRDAKGNITSVTCPAPGAVPGPAYKATFAGCDGDSWDPTVTLALSDRFSIDFVTEQGLTLLFPQTIGQLEHTKVEMKSSIFALPNPDLEVDADAIRFSLQITSASPLFAIPDQFFNPEPVDDSLSVESSTVSNGVVLLNLALPLDSIGAFGAYSVDLKGLQVIAPPYQFIQGSASSGPVSYPGDDPRLLRLSAEIIGVSQVLVTGTAAVASARNLCD